MQQDLKRIFTFQELISRSQYLRYGVLLMFIKYLGEFALFYIFQDRLLTIPEFLNPLLSSRFASKAGPLAASAELGNSHVLLLLYLVWSLPFVWAGFSLSARRALDVGRGTGLAFLFFVPVVNYLLMALLCVLPHSNQVELSSEKRAISSLLFKEAFIVGNIAALSCVGLIAIFVYLFSSYSGALFIGIPFAHGFFITAVLNRHSRRKFADSFNVVFVSLLFTGGLLLIFAMEGAICIAMAAPIFLILSCMGALTADALCARRNNKTNSSLQLFSVFLIPLLIEPISILTDSWRPEAQEVREILTVIEIDAAPAEVWPKVVQFSDLPPATEWIFRLGVAHPLRATIEGQGVGAIRKCQFSTGNFIEPITEWDEPRQLSFDVQYQPHPLKELSFYSGVHAPHLDNFIESKHGQFRLIALPGNRTRLEGRTWYTMKIMPTVYWQSFSDAFIHAIHTRVLEHIKHDVEHANSLGN